jgi:hypothetical protein
MNKSFSTNAPVMETSQIAKAMGWKTRSRVSNLAKRDNWRFVPETGKRDNPRMWYAEDVLLSARAIQRTALVRAIGKAYNKIYVRDAIKTDKYDIKCPVCQGFAIVLPPPRSDSSETAEYYEQIADGTRPWACVNGHSKDGLVKLNNSLDFHLLPWELLEKRPKEERSTT